MCPRCNHKIHLNLLKYHGAVNSAPDLFRLPNQYLSLRNTRFPNTHCKRLLKHPWWWKLLAAQSCPTLCDAMDCSPAGSSVHRDSPGKNTVVGCHSLLQGIFPTQGSNLGSLHCKADSLPVLSHQRSTETPPLTAKIVLDKPPKPTALPLSAQESWRGLENEAMVTNP